MIGYIFKLIIIYVLLVFACASQTTSSSLLNSERPLGEEVFFYSENINELSFYLTFYPADAKEPIPVIYLLNGRGASPYAWVSGADLQKEADEGNVLIVSISAGKTGDHYYVDSKKNPSAKYESYVLEIIEEVEKKYNVRKNKYGRAIGGISMGAIGAVYIASRHPEMFCSVSALSAAEIDEYPPEYENLKKLNLILDIGKDDFLYFNVDQFHKKLERMGITHEYTESWGGHNWEFWSRHYGKHINFHRNNFREVK